MFNLLKYELKKRKNTLIIGVIALIAAEVLTLYQLRKENITIVFVLMGLMLAGTVLLAFLDVAINYYSDFKKSQGTLLFLTPNSGYKIVGSKMIFGAIELLSGVLLVALFMWLTNSLAVNLGYDGIGPQIEQLREMINYAVGSQNIWWVTTGFVFLVYLQYLASQSVAVSSITLGRTIMSRNSYNWLWAVLLFICVNIAIQSINGGILVLIGMKDGVLGTSYTITNAEQAAEVLSKVSKYLIIGGTQYLFWIVTSFFASSTLLNKKIDI